MPRELHLVMALLVLQVALVLLFVVPPRAPEPRGLPVGVVGPAAVLPAGDGFDVRSYADAAAAREAILEREIYGAIAPAERRVLVASAASPAVAQQLRELGTAAGGAPGAEGAAGAARATVEDVVPTAPGDPRGAALAGLFLPLMIACFGLAALLGRAPCDRGPLIAAVLAFAALSGLALTALMRAMDALPGPYPAVSAVVALIVAAVALAATGLTRLLGHAGLGVAAVLFVVVGNPGSGNASAPELLPGFWRVTGQLLPPGAGGQALRDIAYFDGHGLLGPALVLAAWALVGAALVLAARRRPHDTDPPSGTAVAHDATQMPLGRKRARAAAPAQRWSSAAWPSLIVKRPS